MRKENFDHLIAAAVEISGEREIVVIGSQAILDASLVGRSSKKSFARC